MVDLRERLEQTCEIVRGELEKSSDRYKAYADSKSKDRRFKEGDGVLLLLQTILLKFLCNGRDRSKLWER